MLRHLSLFVALSVTSCTGSSDEPTDDTDIVDTDTGEVVETDTDVVETDTDTDTDITIDTDTSPVDSDTDNDTALPPCEIPGWVRDCNFECFSPRNVGNDYCDDGPVPRSDFNCERWEYDGGDCLTDSGPVTVCPFPGEVPDCNGNCWAQSLLGDDNCDQGPDPLPDFACDVFNFDDGDCAIDTSESDVLVDTDGIDTDAIPIPCPLPRETRDCTGACYPEAWLGDGVCDDGRVQPWGSPDFACAYASWDDGDCPTDTDVNP